jgi:hypothetical protein
VCILFVRVVAIQCPAPLSFRQSRTTSLAGSRCVRLHSVTTFPRAPFSRLIFECEANPAQYLPALITSFVDADSVPFTDLCLLLGGQFHSFLLLRTHVRARLRNRWLTVPGWPDYLFFRVCYGVSAVDSTRPRCLARWDQALRRRLLASPSARRRRRVGARILLPRLF